MFLFLSSVALAAPFDAPTEAVSAYLKAADRSDAKGIEQATHEDFRVLAHLPDGLSVLDRNTYLTLVGSKKIGGTPRTRQFEGATVSGPLATVKGTLASEKARFDSTWTLAKTDAGWKVIQDMTVFSPR